MKTFSSSKNIYTYTFFWSIVAFLTIILLIASTEKGETPPSVYLFYVIIIIVIFGLVWVLLDTKYVVKEKLLFYYSGPFRGKIKIEKIRKIKHHSGLIVPVTLKPALDTHGLIISYNQFDDIFITPKEQKEFIYMLLQINPAIEVI